MSKKLRLMAILAHPDDESMGTGGILAKYAAEGVETYLVTATRGERGWFGAPDDYPGPQALGRIREAELLNAARVLGLKEVSFLDYRDGELEEADAGEIIGKLVNHIRRVRPHVVVTFDQSGLYGHPDHVAISQHATAAVIAAADQGYEPGQQPLPPHRVSKLYYMAWTQENLDAFKAGFGEIVIDVNGQKRRASAWQDWAVTTRVDTSAYAGQVWQAVECHTSQLPTYGVLKDLPQEQHRKMWGDQSYYRVFSLVNGGPRTEDDLFEGLRERQVVSPYTLLVAAAD